MLIGAALLFDALEVFEIVFLCFRSHDPMNWLRNLPLFLCSVQAFALPMAAFCKGRLKMAALDFVSIFGVLGMLLGTYGAGQNYACYPVFSFNNVESGLIHGISGFAAIYIFVSGICYLANYSLHSVGAAGIDFCQVIIQLAGDDHADRDP